MSEVKTNTTNINSKGNEGVSKMDPKLVERVKASGTTKKGESKSDKIRKLYDEGVGLTEISQKIGAHYSFVHQVAKNWAQKQGKPFTTNRATKDTKAGKIRQMWEDGMDPGDIAKALDNSNYSYVWSVCDAHRRNLERKIDAQKAKEAKKQ